MRIIKQNSSEFRALTNSRGRDIFTSVINGSTYIKVGLKYSISGNRARQIYLKYIRCLRYINSDRNIEILSRDIFNARKNKDIINNMMIETDLYLKSINNKPHGCNVFLKLVDKNKKTYDFISVSNILKISVFKDNNYRKTPFCLQVDLKPTINNQHIEVKRFRYSSYNHAVYDSNFFIEVP